MTSKLIFPDVTKRDKQDPAKLVSSAEVLEHYNLVQAGTETPVVTEVTEVVKEWACNLAINEGWAEASFVGNQLLLSSVETSAIPVFVATKKPKKADTGTFGKRASAGSLNNNAIQHHVPASVAESNKIFGKK